MVNGYRDMPGPESAVVPPVAFVGSPHLLCGKRDGMVPKHEERGSLSLKGHRLHAGGEGVEICLIGRGLLSINPYALKGTPLT